MGKSEPVKIAPPKPISVRHEHLGEVLPPIIVELTRTVPEHEYQSLLAEIKEQYGGPVVLLRATTKLVN